MKIISPRIRCWRAAEHSSQVAGPIWSIHADGGWWKKHSAAMDRDMLRNLRKHAIMKNTVVWLLAAVLFHSPLCAPVASAGCVCRGEAGQGDCCSRRVAKQRTRSCCNARTGHLERQSTTRLGEACRCGTSCACSRESAPAPPVIPSTSRNRLVGELALALANISAPSSAGVELPRVVSYRHGGGPAPATSLDRCIDLSRFTL